MAKRSHIDVIHDMLFACREKGGEIKPTHLLYKANLSHAALQRYLAELREKGLLREEEGKAGKRYLLTDEGHRFLTQVQRFREFSEQFGI